MNAIVITQPGGPEVLELRQLPLPVPGPHEVLLQVAAAGVNRPDVLLRQGKYRGSGDVSGLVPGLEVAGTVAQCGAAVTRWQPGDAVCALLTQGGYAEYAAVDARHCLPLPTGWTPTQAASLPETVFTVWHNVFQRGQLQPHETLLVHGGSSGIGVTAVQLARALGSKVAATAGSAEKCAAVRALGAEWAINYKEADFEAMLAAAGGVDVILDMIGGDYTPKNLRLLREDGRLVFINAMQGSTASFNALEVMARRLTITGSTLRPRSAEFKAALAAEVERHVWPLLAAGSVRPVIHATLPLTQAADAHRLLESSAHIGKIVLTVPG
ncbi:putative PIG3 family NAD(P)H quinone oxidoreductase [Hymenobacter luteus]|uniref:PIG3 family NAD(P)H quinone oxidoreductase n=2 Tax=Hymenobacter TaxID=89966 RepID=A0ABR6JZW8_9BACT|nr:MULTISPECIES: NAD(P)H-quinone oxidoreductase [Hymenobacter]MBB4601783.1 putative PIG3 family NAD(P)H quinone oxidoreductase [Hymenobacter latericoloratus]MBB6059788.1 putative PIG3 family NAD(P)H quinone oxidoreductase [Hymenobacter luteus]